MLRAALDFQKSYYSTSPLVDPDHILVGELLSTGFAAGVDPSCYRVYDRLAPLVRPPAFTAPDPDVYARCLMVFWRCLETLGADIQTIDRVHLQRMKALEEKISAAMTRIRAEEIENSVELPDDPIYGQMIPIGEEILVSRTAFVRHGVASYATCEAADRLLEAKAAALTNHSENLTRLMTNFIPKLVEIAVNHRAFLLVDDIITKLDAHELDPSIDIPGVLCKIGTPLSAKTIVRSNPFGDEETLKTALVALRAIKIRLSDIYPKYRILAYRGDELPSELQSLLTEILKENPSNGTMIRRILHLEILNEHQTYGAALDAFRFFNDSKDYEKMRLLQSTGLITPENFETRLMTAIEGALQERGDIEHARQLLALSGGVSPFPNYLSLLLNLVAKDDIAILRFVHEELALGSIPPYDLDQAIAKANLLRASRALTYLESLKPASRCSAM